VDFSFFAFDGRSNVNVHVCVQHLKSIKHGLSERHGWCLLRLSSDLAYSRLVLKELVEPKRTANLATLLQEPRL
jgi:hypothetical protein